MKKPTKAAVEVAALRAWRRVPAKERAHLLQYMREEADDFDACHIAEPAQARAWARANRAAVALLVAVAGEPKPREKKPRKRARMHR